MCVNVVFTSHLPNLCDMVNPFFYAVIDVGMEDVVKTVNLVVLYINRVS